MDDSETIGWRRDATTSRSIRVLWALGLGTLVAAILLVVAFRFFSVAAELGVVPVFVAALAAVGATALAIGLGGESGPLETIVARFPGLTSAETDVRRLGDVLVATVVMATVIFALGQVVSGGLGNGAAALTVPLAFVALVIAAFLRSAGAIAPEERALYLFDPDRKIDLDTVDRVHIREIGGGAVVSLSYDQSDGVYVDGPRRLILPPRAARELERLVDG